MDCKRKTWRNWEGSYKCAAEVCIANSVEDFRQVVHKAKTEGKTIRVSGGGRPNPYSGSFSGSPVVINPGNIIVRMPEFNRAWALNDGSNRVVAEAGMTVKELDIVLRQNRLSLLTETAPDFMTVGGAVSTSSHGCGRHTGTMSDLVVGMTILNHEGELIEIGDDDPDLLRAAQVSLGALGIVVNVTFQCVPEYKLIATDTGKITLEDALSQAQDLFETHDHLEYLWYPFNDTVWVKMWDRAPGHVATVNGPGRFENLKQRFLGATSDAVMKVSTNLPRLTPLSCRTLMSATPEHTMIAPPPDVFHYQDYFPQRLFDLSYAIDTGDNFQKFRSAFEFTAEKIYEFAKPINSRTSPWPWEYGSGAQFVMNFNIHCRFIKGSKGYMAPATGHRHTCMFEAITYMGTPCQDFYGQVEQHWLSLGGRPHWGKTYSPNLDFKAIYGANWDKFNRIRRQMDPHGIFLNDFTRHVFHA
jgi:L-gulono-1,4-lactone dehydrogenase